MGPFELVLFDMDGVIADTEPLHLEAANQVLAEEGVRLTAADGREFLGSTDAELFAALKQRRGLRQPVERLVAAKTRATIGLIRTGLAPAPGVCELLIQLKMRSIPAVVASSSLPELIDAVVDCLGLRSSFAGLFSAQLVGRGKPHPDLFLLAAQSLGVPPRDCLVIEDAPAGIRAARAAGMAVAAVRTRLTEEVDLSDADLVLDSLLQFDYEILDGC
ncbi:MAG: HAD family phosphatase [Planctomycetes bacterium]|nr:HAD family phosphatase [Planctomycetota bacterium]